MANITTIAATSAPQTPAQIPVAYLRQAEKPATDGHKVKGL